MKNFKLLTYILLLTNTLYLSAMNDFDKAILNSLGSRPYPEILFENTQNLLTLDDLNKEFNFSNVQNKNKNKNIIQLPALYQNYKCLENKKINSNLPSYTYGDNGTYNNLCPIYALFFAKTLSENNTADEKTLKTALNNRTEFEKLLLSSINAQEDDINNCANLSGDQLNSLAYKILTKEVTNHLIIPHATSAENIEIKENLKESFIKGNEKFLIYILNSSNTGSHWYTVLVRKNQTNTIELIITDSIGINRISYEDIISIYNDLNENNKKNIQLIQQSLKIQNTIKNDNKIPSLNLKRPYKELNVSNDFEPKTTKKIKTTTIGTELNVLKYVTGIATLGAMKYFLSTEECSNDPIFCTGFQAGLVICSYTIYTFLYNFLNKNTK